MTENIKRIPYGVSDFEAMRTENCYFVDKTRFIRPQHPRERLKRQPANVSVTKLVLVYHGWEMVYRG